MREKKKRTPRKGPSKVLIIKPLPAKRAEIPAVVGSARVGPAEHLVEPVLRESLPVGMAVVFLRLVILLAKALPFLGKVDAQKHPCCLLSGAAGGAELDSHGNLVSATDFATFELVEEHLLGDFHVSS